MLQISRSAAFSAPSVLQLSFGDEIVCIGDSDEEEVVKSQLFRHASRDLVILCV